MWICFLLEITDECCNKLKDENVNLGEMILNKHLTTLSKDIPEFNMAGQRFNKLVSTIK